MLWACIFFTLFMAGGIMLPQKRSWSTACLTTAVPLSILVIMGYYCSRIGIKLSLSNLLIVYGIVLAGSCINRVRTEGTKEVLLRLCVSGVISVFFVLIFTYIRILPPGYGVDTARHLALSEYVYLNQEYPHQGWEFIHSQYYLYPMGTATLTGLFSYILEIDPVYSLYPLMGFITVLLCLTILSILPEFKAPHSVYFLCCIFLTFTKLFFCVSALSFYAQITGLYFLTVFLVSTVKRENAVVLAVVETALIFSYPLYALLPFFAYLVHMVSTRKWRNVFIFFGLTGALSYPFAFEHLYNALWLAPTPVLSYNTYWKEGIFLVLALVVAACSFKVFFYDEKGRILLIFVIVWIIQIPVLFVLNYFGIVELYFLYKQVFILLVLLPIFCAFSVSKIVAKLTARRSHRVRTSCCAVTVTGILVFASLNMAAEISLVKSIPPPLTEEDYYLALDLRYLSNIAGTNESLEGFSSARHVHLLMLSAISQTFIDVLSFEEFRESVERSKYQYIIVEREDYHDFSIFSRYHLRKKGTFTYLLENKDNSNMIRCIL